jgi:hypothetical protein
MSAIQQYQLWIGLAFATLLVAFLICAFFFAPRMSDDQRAILRFLSALCAGFAGALITGDALFRASGKSGTFEYAVSGTAGCALFFAVWFSFSRVKGAPPGFSFSVPDGWTFQQVVDAIVNGEQAVVDFSGFKRAEMSALLKASSISVKTASDALHQLRLMTKTANAIRQYDVRVQDSVYRLTIRDGDQG